MITLLPEVTETLVVAHRGEVVLERLSEVTTSRSTELEKTSKLFAGWIKDDRFQLIIRQRRPNSFMPLVEGRVDPTSNGCLIFLRYRLMPSTRMYLVLWSFIAFFSGIFLTVHYEQLLLGAVSIGSLILIHGIACANFRIHRKPLRALIFRILA